MAVRTLVSLDEARVFLVDYVEERPLAIAGVARGTVNSSYEVGLPGRRLFVRVYEEQGFEGACAEAERLSLLADRGVATPAPLRRKEGGFIGRIAGKPAAVFPWREGDMRCLAAVTPADAEQVGVALARLHCAGAGVPRSPGRFEPAQLRRRLERIARAPSAELAALAEPLAMRLDTWEARRATDLPRGLIHGDLFRDNVLWTPDGALSALLDFESASDGPFAYDLMVTILAWCFKDALDEPIARSIVAGYERERPLDAGERAGLLAEGAIAAIRFTVTRLTDDALRALEEQRPPRPDKDYRRFLRRLEWLESRGEAGLAQALFR